MDDQLPAPATPARPSKDDAEVRACVEDKTWNELDSWAKGSGCCLSRNDFPMFRSAFRNIRPHHNGYQVAKILEDVIGIEPDDDLVERMGAVIFTFRFAHRKVVLKWIQDHNIVPTLPIGTSITSPAISGTINAYDTSIGEYIVTEKGETIVPGSGFLIAYEDACPVSASSAEA